MNRRPHESRSTEIGPSRWIKIKNDQKKKKKKSMRLYADYSLDNRQGVGIEIYVLGSFFFQIS